MKKTSIPTSSEQRAAALAVSRYGAERARVEQVVKEVAAKRARGVDADLITALVESSLLSLSQANSIRNELVGASGEAPATAVPNTNTPLAESGQPLSPTASGLYLKSLGNFRLLRRLGQGGMGSVYLAYEEGAKRQVAIKVLSDQLSSNQAYVERFYREAKSGGQLDHPNIVRFISAGQDKASGKHYLVMEFVDGESAHALLERHRQLRVADAVHLILDIARGLEHAHSRNIIHRDIKPDNILITKSGVAKLADLGLAKRLDEVSNLTGLRVGFGTVDYIPYEQSMSAKHADARSDIYALGATLYHLITGQVPFPATNYLEVAEKKQKGVFAPASSLNSEASPELERILAKMLARKPENRYQMVSELIVDLERSNLAAAIPSFADPERIWEDPLVRSRLASPSPPTQLDVQTQANQQALPSGNGNADSWVLRFRNREGQVTKKKMSTRQILDALRERRVGTQVEASRNHRGDFYPLSTFPEFAEAASASPQTETALRDSEVIEQPACPKSWPWGWIAVGTGLTALVSGIVAYIWYTS